MGRCGLDMWQNACVASNCEVGARVKDLSIGRWIAVSDLQTNELG